MVSWFVKQALLDIADDIGVKVEEPKTREEWARPDAARRRQGHPHRRARHAARARPEADGRVRQHLVGRGLPVGRAAAGRARLGHAREMDAGERPHATRPAAAPRSICCSRAPTRACAPGRRRRARNTASWSRTTSRSRSPTTSRCARTARRSYRPTCHYAYHPCNDAVLSLHELFGQRGQAAGEAAHPRRARDRRRHRRARRAALRPRQERLLVRLAALDRGDAAARALPERDRPAGDLRGARRHGVGAGESGGAASSRPTRWTSAAASRSRCPISGR